MLTFGTLIRRSLRYHWRAHLGVVLGAAVGSAALIGALVVGDSVKLTLKQQALDRLANASFALRSGDRFFRTDLLERFGAVGSNRVCQAASGGVTNGEVIWGRAGSPVDGRIILELSASVSRQDGAARANHVQLLGVSNSELQWARTGRLVFPSETVESPPSGEVWVNATLARQLALKAGDELLVRIRKPSALSSEVTISSRNDSTVVLRLRVGGVSRKSSSGVRPST